MSYLKTKHERHMPVPPKQKFRDCGLILCGVDILEESRDVTVKLFVVEIFVDNTPGIEA